MHELSSKCGFVIYSCLLSFIFCLSSNQFFFFRFVYFSFLLFHLSLIHRVSGSYENTGKVLNRFVPSSSFSFRSPPPPYLVAPFWRSLSPIFSSCLPARHIVRNEGLIQVNDEKKVTKRWRPDAKFSCLCFPLLSSSFHLVIFFLKM